MRSHHAALLGFLAATAWYALLHRALAASLPHGLDQKPLLEQLLARKAYIAEHLRGEAWSKYVRQLEAGFSKPGNQRGMLIVAGGRDMFANAAITLHVLRGVIRSTVPVEIVHFGPKELPPHEILDFISSLNNTAAAGGGASTSRFTSGPVYITDALASAPPNLTAGHHRTLPEGIKGFAAKVYAVTHATRFKQVLLLDADSMPLVDPHLLFHIPLFQRSGSLFWPDLWHSAWVNETIYRIVGGMKEAPWVGKRQHRLVDSGQMLIDRLRHAEVLEFLWLLNSHHEWVYKHMHGDKDTFLLAFAMAERLEQFKQVPSFARDAMREIPGHQHKFHHLGMVQSIPASMLAAAVRAAARAGQQLAPSPPGVGVSGRADPHAAAASGVLGRRGGPQRYLLLAGAGTGSGSSHSSSSSASLGTLTSHPLGSSSSHWWLDGSSESSGSSASADTLTSHLLGSSSSQWSVDGSIGSSSRRLQQPGQDSPDEGEDLGDDSDGVGGGGDVVDGSETEHVPARRLAPALAAAAAAAAAAGGGRRPDAIHAGVPVFFHRTSFNSKWFPDCLDAHKIRTHYCEVQWVSVPLSNEQAGHSLKPNMYAWNADQIDTSFYQQHCSSGRNGSSRASPQMSAWVAAGLGIDQQQQQQVASAGRHMLLGLAISSGSSIQEGAAPATLPWLPQQQQPPRHLVGTAVHSDTYLQHGSVKGSTGGTSRGSRVLSGIARLLRKVLRHRQRRPRALEQFGGLPPEHACDKLPVGQDLMPIPVMRVGLFQHMDGVLRGSYEAFRAVRQALKVDV